MAENDLDSLIATMNKKQSYSDDNFYNLGRKVVDKSVNWGAMRGFVPYANPIRFTNLILKEGYG